jgi:hypothetical protein
MLLFHQKNCGRIRRCPCRSIRITCCRKLKITGADLFSRFRLSISTESWFVSTLFTVCTIFLNINCKIMAPEHTAVQCIDSTLPEPIHCCFNSSCSEVRISIQLPNMAYCDFARNIIQQPRLSLLQMICF